MKKRLYVVKRDGRQEVVMFDKITSRIQKLCYNLDKDCIDECRIAQKVCSGIYPGVTTSELDELAAQTASSLVLEHPDYGLLAARIAMSNLHKNTHKSFVMTMKLLHEYVNPQTNKPAPLISDECWKFIETNAEILDSSILYSRDFEYDYFGLQTLERGYLLRTHGKIVERPQHMLMRVACDIHVGNITSALETYEALSRGWFTHASPTLYNAGTNKRQLSSCFLLTIKDDSIEGIYDTLKDTALISKMAGGVGLAVSKIRATGSYIAGTNGTSNGLVPMLRVFNNTARYVDQCFGPQTIIFTSCGPMSIKHAKVGDLILSTNGVYNRIDKVLKHEFAGNLLQITSTLSRRPVMVTHEHQVLALQGQNGITNLETIQYRLSNGFARLQMVDAKDLLVGDYVCYPDVLQRYLPKKSTTDHFVYKGTIFNKIKTIKQEYYTGTLYDFEVARAHTYVTLLGGVHNGGGKRKGAFAIYLEPWHADIFEFLELRKNHGAEELRARDLFYALWIPDLYMERVRDDGTWSLFCPTQAPGLDQVWGSKFKELYEKYEKTKGITTKVIRARDLWNTIMQAQIETGNPYMLYKDACNSKSNQQNLGTIQCSNLCTEIIEYTAPNEIAVCNLASIALPKFVDVKTRRFNHTRLFQVIKIIVNNLNRIIDINYYPVNEAKYSNLRNRPLAIGVQGLADTFILLRLAYESIEAQQLNREIFETIYFAALTASHELAKKDGAYETYDGSPLSQGKFQFDLWGATPSSKRWDWDALRKSILQDKIGVRNSLLIAPMPTASTSQILGNNECFEPFTSNLYVRRTLAGEFICINKYLVQDLLKLGLWNDTMRQKLMISNGSVLNIPEIPEDLQRLYKTVWEMKNATLVDMAADRAIYIDQSQSLNVYMAEPTIEKLTSYHFYTWQKGLKTGMYYLRTKAANEAIKFTVDQTLLKLAQQKTNETKQSEKLYEQIPSVVATVETSENMSCPRRKKRGGLDNPECISCSG